MSKADPISTHVPELVESYSAWYAKMFVRVHKCRACERPMVYPPGERDKTFPSHYSASFGAQIRRAGFVVASSAKVDDSVICVECKEEGKASFVCALCGERRKSDLIEDYFGDPPEFLCAVCYETVPAKTYDEKKAELRDGHRWDYC